MKATDILMDEHRVIERVLSSMETAADRVRSNEPVRPGFFIEAAGFIQGFADTQHHKKEENHLFEELMVRGVAKEGGPIAVMLDEHEQARALTRSMREAAERWDGGDASARDEVVSSAEEYAALLRSHIAKEDQVLFPMAEQVIPAEEQTRLAATFERIDGEETEALARKKYLALVESLEKEIG